MSLSPAQWTSVQEALRSQVGEDDFNSWLLPLRPEPSTMEDGVISLSVPTRFIQDWVDEHYGDLLKSSLSEALQRDISLSYVVKPTFGDISEQDVLASVGKSVVATKVQAEISATPSTPVSKPAESAADVALPDSTRLDPRFTFESYVTGKSNDFAFAAAQRIAESETPVYNPFFLHGGVGLGKTHLMHAIGARIKETFPQRRVLYISAEQFLYRFVRALKDRKTLSFKDTFRAVDVLMIDDIQFIAGKEATQEEFFHTFNTLVDQGKQIILTADRSPHEMENVEDRLRSRLGCGLTCEIHAPDVETRQAILQKKAEQLRLDIPHTVIQFLADGIVSNVRELEGALNRLAAHAQLSGAAIDLDFAQTQLRDLFRANERVVTIEDIQRRVSDYFGIQLSDLLGTRRMRPIARPRQVAMYLAKKMTSKSYPDIGKAFGGRDHTTVMHAVRTIENLLEREAELKEKVTLLEKMLMARS